MERIKFAQLSDIWKAHGWNKNALAELFFSYFGISDRRPEKPGFYPECKPGEVIFNNGQRLLEPQFLS